MPYILTRIVMGGPHPELKLSEEDFFSIVEAKRGLFTSLWIEEKFGLVLDNYLEFEVELLEQSLRVAVFREFAYSSAQDRLYTAARRISNLLSSCRAYIDQTHSDLAGIYEGKQDVVDAIRTAFATQYEMRLGYRAMEALRNFSQHRSLPLHGISASYSRVDAATPPHRIVSVPQLRVERLEEDAGFKRTVLAELKATGRKVLDLRPLLREYMQGLAAAHRQVRSLMENDLSRWESTLTVHISRWQQEASDSTIGLAAVYRDDDGEERDEEELFTEFIERRRELVSRHQQADGLGSIFVSNEELRS